MDVLRMLLNFSNYSDSEKKLIKRIQTYDWAKLERLWVKIKAGVKTRWPDGKALEYMFVRAFDLEGAEVVYPYNNLALRAQEQLDGYVFVKDLGVGFIIECKDWSVNVSFDELAKLHGRLLYRMSSTYGIFLSKTGYTSSAMELTYMVNPHNILLWSSDDIDECFKNHKFLKALQYKYQYAMVTTDPMIAIMDGINV